MFTEVIENSECEELLKNISSVSRLVVSSPAQVLLKLYMKWSLWYQTILVDKRKPNWKTPAFCLKYEVTLRCRFQNISTFVKDLTINTI